MKNQTPEQLARDQIDKQLTQSGWVIQDYRKYNPNAGLGVAVREYPTSTGPIDYLLIVDREPVGIIEAKPENFGHRITTVEEQTKRYADSDIKNLDEAEVPFLFESTGVVTHFTNRYDPNPRAREIFSFFRPETLQKWFEDGKNTLRYQLQHIPKLNPNNLPSDELGLRDCQERAITNMEKSLADAKPRALIQMATGAGKTYTAISIMYRLLKYTGKRRILFLVDTVNLGEQAEQEMLVFHPLDDNRKFTELHSTQLIKSSSIPNGVEVYITTIQRMYSMLKADGVEAPVDDLSEEEMEEWQSKQKQPLPVTYHENLPPRIL